QSNQGCLVADASKRMWSFYRFHLPDPVFFDKDLKATIQAMGGTGLGKVRNFITNGVPIKPVSMDNNGNFIRFLETNSPKIADASLPKGWVNFYREDDYCTTAYFYLDRPVTELPTLPPLTVRTAKIK